MKKLLCIMLLITILLFPALAGAEISRTQTEVNILHFMAKAALDSLGEDVPGIPEIAYDEELDVFYMVYVDESMTAMEHKFRVASSPEYKEKKASVCREYFCKYFFDYVDAVGISVDIAIRHFDKNGNFMYCMYNGIYQDDDIY